MSAAPRPLRAIVVDDSDASRAELARILAGGGHVVVAEARDGEEALGRALELEPDVVVLDLQMPRMDGFTFLRLLMARRPTPVLVVSSQSGKSDVFKCLELGAIDFVAKPDRAGVAAAADDLLQKCEVVRALRIDHLDRSLLPLNTPVPMRPVVEPARVAVIGASTGGPQALLHLLGRLPGDLPLGILVAQHMPERFTRPFAERLGRGTRFSVQEASDGDLVAEGRVLVAPGGRHLVVRRDAGGALRAAILPVDPRDPSRYVPSVDRLFESAARALGPRASAVVLTGMGNDGSAGAAAIRAAGGRVLAESERSAMVYGMPLAAKEAGAVDELLDLEAIADRLAELARGR